MPWHDISVLWYVALCRNMTCRALMIRVFTWHDAVCCVMLKFSFDSFELFFNQICLLNVNNNAILLSSVHMWLHVFFCLILVDLDGKIRRIYRTSDNKHWHFDTCCHKYVSGIWQPMDNHTKFKFIEMSDGTFKIQVRIVHIFFDQMPFWKMGTVQDVDHTLERN